MIQAKNRVICVYRHRINKIFFRACGPTRLPDLQLISNGPVFPTILLSESSKGIRCNKTRFMGLMNPIVLIIFRTPRCTLFKKHYHDNTITKDAIFDYVYGILHGPSYREAFANDLSKENTAYPIRSGFPRIRRSRESPCGATSRLRDMRTVTHFPSCSLMTESHNRIIFD